MQLTALLDKIAGRQREREHARQSDFRTIVTQIADGREPDADHVDRVLNEANKTLDDLRLDVERLQRRRELRKQVDQIPGLLAERRDVENRIKAADKALDDAEQRHAETTFPPTARLDEIRDSLSAAETAKRELVDTCTDAGLLAEVETVAADLTAAYNEARACRETLKQHRSQARIEHANAERAQAIVQGQDLVNKHLGLAGLAEYEVEQSEAKLAK
ncbi:MAG: hypothetical protein JJ992_10160, partial [Planctomycetes bacterium]|nr:hypothetical protein [Planctomycetota bacterium]